MDIYFFKEAINSENYFINQLTLSSTLLGLIIATSTFILQSGFSSFKFSRSMFLKYYVKQSKFLFTLLTYNIFQSLVFLYIKDTEKIAFLLHLAYGVAFSKQLFSYYSHKGYIRTISTEGKFNTRTTRLGIHFRYILNLGIVDKLFILCLIMVVVIYPFYIGNFCEFKDRQGIASTLITFTICIYSLIRIMPQFFEFSEKEYQQKETDILNEDNEIDISQELIILEESLIKSGIKELKERVQEMVL